jgi:hypothetical protein
MRQGPGALAKTREKMENYFLGPGPNDARAPLVSAIMMCDASASDAAQ